MAGTSPGHDGEEMGFLPVMAGLGPAIHVVLQA